MGFSTVLLFCDVHIDIGTTLNLPQSSCMRVICGCRAIQTNSAETSLALLQCSYYCHSVISSGSPPVFLECTSNTYTSKLTLLCIHPLSKNRAKLEYRVNYTSTSNEANTSSASLPRQYTNLSGFFSRKTPGYSVPVKVFS